MLVILLNCIFVDFLLYSVYFGMLSLSLVESPSSCASYADDLNNQAMMDKVDMAKDGGSSNVTGNHVISARNHPSLLRLLNFVCICCYHFYMFPCHWNSFFYVSG